MTEAEIKKIIKKNGDENATKNSRATTAVAKQRIAMYRNRKGAAKTQQTSLVPRTRYEFELHHVHYFFASKYRTKQVHKLSSPPPRPQPQRSPYSRGLYPTKAAACKSNMTAIPGIG